jgi:crossover junction endodeoxyribonuclease RuvC
VRRILGLDPGSSATGWSVIDSEGSRHVAVAWGVIRPRGAERAEKLADLSNRLSVVLAEHAPDEAAIETPFTGRNPRSAIALAEARGAILAAVGLRGLTVKGYSPAAVKQATVGHGRADKTQIAYMVTRLFHLPTTPAEDACDALAIAWTHLQHGRITAVVPSVRR